ncbi:hypothetical protein D3C76_912360 [compost metagenome]
MCQGQIGQQTVAGTGATTAVIHAAGHGRRVVHTAEAVHDALGVTGTAGGVNDRGEFARLWQYHFNQRSGRSHDSFPCIAFTASRHGQINQRQPCWNAGTHGIPASGIAIQATDKNQPHLGVFEYIRHCVDIGSGVQRHADVAGHPDRHIGDDPVGGVLAENANGRFRRQLEGL